MTTPEQIHALCKELRREVSALPVKKMCQLDYSDKMMVADRLRALINDALYLKTVADAQCSQVLELWEHFGGKVPTAKG